MKFDEFEFGSPWWLLALLVVPLVAMLAGGRGPLPAVRFSGLAPLRAVAGVARAGRGGLRRSLLLLALALFVVALARPRLGNASDTIESSGVDIVIAMDVSGSMFAEDFTIGGERVNRLDAVKDVTRRFIAGRPNDRIGIVAFAGRPYLVSPLTLDHGWLEKNLARIKIGLVEDGTAIGAAIASGVNRLKDRPAKSKILLLLTDGDETVPTLPPATAAEAAKLLGIKIYTIAAGTRGEAPMPRLTRSRSTGEIEVARDLFGNKLYHMAPVTVNEEVLTEVARLTNGQFFRATDSESLERIFAQIDEMEKTEVTLKRKVDWREMFQWFIAAGTALAALHAVLLLTVGRTLP